MIDAVLLLTEHYYRLFPVRPGDKCPPLIKGWPANATSTHNRLRRWWRQWPTANIGGATGNGWAVVDVDPRHGGTLEAVEALGLSLDTRTVRTPSGGWQMHYLVDAPVISRAPALGPGIDVKGDGGYVLLPPSIRADGEYTWLRGLDTPMLRADAAVLNRVNCTDPTTGWPIGSSRNSRFEEIREGERHAQAVLWCSWFHLNYDPDDAADLMWQLVARFADPVPYGDPGIAGIIDWFNKKHEKEAAA